MLKCQRDYNDLRPCFIRLDEIALFVAHNPFQADITAKNGEMFYLNGNNDWIVQELERRSINPKK